MGKKKNVKRFASHLHLEETITDASGVIGTIRIKPSTVMWKPKGAKGPMPYYGLSIEEFETLLKKHGRRMCQ